MKQKLGWVSIVIASGLFLWGVVYFSNLYLAQKSGHSIHESKTVSCKNTQGTAYVATIFNDRITPLNTDAQLCDTLTIINNDANPRLIAFGVHDQHTPYDGVEEKILKKDESIKITLNQQGKFLFHDHDDDSVRGTFTVR